MPVNILFKNIGIACKNINNKIFIIISSIYFVVIFQNALFRTDMKLVNEPLMYHVNLITTAEQKNFFDLLHFSPLKVYCVKLHNCNLLILFVYAAFIFYISVSFYL